MAKEQVFLFMILLISPLLLCHVKDDTRTNLADDSNEEGKIFNWYIYELCDYLMYLIIVVVITVVIYFVIKSLRGNRYHQQQLQPQKSQTKSQNTAPLIQNECIQTHPYYLPINSIYCGICNQLLMIQNMTNQIITSKIVMQCKHSFHYECIAHHFKNHTTCPSCCFVP